MDRLDSDIIAEVLAGERNAYAELVRRYEARVRGLCRMMLGDATQAEDAAQEVFIKAYQALSRFRGASSFSTWIYRIAANQCKDLLRKAAHERSESWEALLEREGEKIEALFITSNTSRDDEERTELVTKLLAHLSEKSRHILVLREIQELSYDEISETLQCSLDAVKARLKRARAEMEEKVRHFLGPQSV